MTTFAEMVDLTIANTKRPELVALTESCVRLATLRAHQVDFFIRDMANLALPYIINHTGPFVDIPLISTLFPRKRTIKFLHSIDLSTMTPTETLRWREYSDFWDEDGVLRTSVYTEIGDTLRVRPAIQTGQLDIIAYVNPKVTPPLEYASWIANEHPDEVAMWAAGLIWARTGFLEQARVAQDLHITPFKDLLVSSYLIGTVN